jgi:hypothetical protein
MKSIQGIHLAGQIRYYLAKGGRLRQLGIKENKVHGVLEEIGIAQRGITGLNTNERVIAFMSNPSNQRLIEIIGPGGLAFRKDDEVKELTGEQIISLLWQRMRTDNNILNDRDALKLRHGEALEGGYELIAHPELMAKRHVIPTILYYFNQTYTEAMRGHYVEHEVLKVEVDDPAQKGKTDLVDIKYNGIHTGELNFWVELNNQIISRKQTH